MDNIQKLHQQSLALPLLTTITINASKSHSSREQYNNASSNNYSIPSLRPHPNGF